MDCLFCHIISKKIPSEVVYESDSVLGFKDISPMANKHFLFVHKNHSESIGAMASNDIAQVFISIQEFTKEQFTEGFRVVTNSGEHGGQSVFHTHFHVLGGETLSSFGA